MIVRSPFQRSRFALFATHSNMHQMKQMWISMVDSVERYCLSWKCLVNQHILNTFVWSSRTLSVWRLWRTYMGTTPTLCHKLPRWKFKFWKKIRGYTKESPITCSFLFTLCPTENYWCGLVRWTMLLATDDVLAGRLVKFTTRVIALQLLASTRLIASNWPHF